MALDTRPLAAALRGVVGISGFNDHDRRVPRRFGSRGARTRFLMTHGSLRRDDRSAFVRKQGRPARARPADDWRYAKEYTLDPTEELEESGSSSGTMLDQAVVAADKRRSQKPEARSQPRALRALTRSPHDKLRPHKQETPMGPHTTIEKRRRREAHEAQRTRSSRARGKKKKRKQERPAASAPLSSRKPAPVASLSRGAGPAGTGVDGSAPKAPRSRRRRAEEGIVRLALARARSEHDDEQGDSRNSGASSR